MALRDIDRCWEAVRHARRPRIHTFVATSDIHLKYKLRKTRAGVLAAAVGAVRHARGSCEDVEFVGSPGRGRGVLLVGPVVSAGWPA